jgi:hypothetical protein
VITPAAGPPPAGAMRCNAVRSAGWQSFSAGAVSPRVAELPSAETMSEELKPVVAHRHR